MRARWIAACTGGEAMGMAAVAATYAAIDRGLIGPAFVWISVAGAFEGLCLGAAQATALRGNVRARRWIGLTVAGAVAGYALAALGGAGSDGAPGPEPAGWLIALAGAGLGLVMGALMGAVQVPALPADLRSLPWIAANAVGWAPGMAAIMLAATAAGRETPLATVALSGAVAGAVAGICVGIATWTVLRRVAA